MPVHVPGLPQTDPRAFPIPKMDQHRGFQVRRILSDRERKSQEDGLPVSMEDSEASQLARRIEFELSHYESLIYFNDIFESDKGDSSLGANACMIGEFFFSACARVSMHMCMCVSARFCAYT